MKAWNNIAKAACLPLSRRAKPRKGTVERPIQEEPPRVLPEVTVCTAHLLQILTALSFREASAGGCGSVEAAASNKRVLQSLISRSDTRQLSVRIASKCNVDASGIAIRDSAQEVVVEMAVQDTRVPLRPLIGVSLPARFKHTKEKIMGVVRALHRSPVEAVPLS